MKNKVRTKHGPTPKQNKYKNPLYARKVFFHLSKGMSQIKAFGIIQKRKAGKK